MLVILVGLGLKVSFVFFAKHYISITFNRQVFFLQFFEPPKRSTFAVEWVSIRNDFFIIQMNAVLVVSCVKVTMKFELLWAYYVRSLIP